MESQTVQMLELRRHCRHSSSFPPFFPPALLRLSTSSSSSGTGIIARPVMVPFDFLRQTPYRSGQKHSRSQFSSRSVCRHLAISSSVLPPELVSGQMLTLADNTVESFAKGQGHWPQRYHKFSSTKSNRPCSHGVLRWHSSIAEKPAVGVEKIKQAWGR